MKDILDRLKLLESEKPRAALLDKKFSSFRDMEQLQGDASITTAHKPVKMGDQQKGLTGKLVGTTEAVENTVEDLVAKLGSEFKSQFMGDKKQPKKDQDLTDAPADRDIGEKKPAKDIHVKEQGVAEGGSLDRYRQRVNSQGFTDSPEERNADRLERKRRHNAALDRIADIGGGGDEERAHQAQQRMARDEYKLDRMKRDDDDWENTFDVMRDRLNRYQWSSQRDVDPEQLAAISNIKYEPRKKNEAVQAKTDDNLLAYYAQRKAEKEKQGTSKGGQVHGQPEWQKPRVPSSTFTPGKPLPQSLQQKLDGKTNTGRAVEAKADPTGSWVVHDGNKVKKFKTREGAKAYAEKNGGTVASSEYYHDKIAKKDVTEGEQRVDSLVTDALKIMQGSEVNDAIKALKTVLGDREYNGRRGHYNFYVKQILDMSSQQGVEEGLGDDERRAFKRQELQHELGHEKNNIQVSINGKPWKVFPGKGYADSTEEYRHLQSMKVWAAKKSAGSGKTWTVSLTGADANMNEGVEMSTAGPMGSMPTDDIPQVQHVTEDWGSSDWTPVMKGMWDVIDRHYAGRANPESIEDAAQNAAEFYYDDMGYDEVEDAKDRIIGMFLRRPDGIRRKQDKTPAQELEEAGVIPAGAPALAPTDAGMQGQLNVKQLASVLPGIDVQALTMAMTALKAGSAPSMAQQKALAGAFAALVKADPQTTTKAMAILKKVSAEPEAAPVAAPVAAKPAPAPTAPVGTPAPAPAVAPAPAAESMDYIKENKRKR